VVMAVSSNEMSEIGLLVGRESAEMSSHRPLIRAGQSEIGQLACLTDFTR